MYIYACIYVNNILRHIIDDATAATGWRRLIGSPKLQIIFHKRAIKYRSLLRKMTCKDKGSYESSPPCMIKAMHVYMRIYIYSDTHKDIHKQTHIHHTSRMGLSLMMQHLLPCGLLAHTHIHTHTHTHTNTDTDTGTDTGTQTHRYVDTQTHRHTDT